MWALVGGSRDSGVRRGYFGNFQSSSTRRGDNQRRGWAEQDIATQIVSQIAERSVRQLAAKYAERGALEERTNEMTAAAVARPVGMEVATARCRSGAEWRRQKDINRRAKEVIRARQKKADEDAVARAAHTQDVVRQSAGAAENKRKRRAEKNKRHRKNKQVKRIHEEWKEELKEKAEEDWEAQSNAVVEEGAVLVAVQWRTRQAVRALRAARWQQQMQELSEWKAEQFGGARVQLGRGWHRWRQRCSAPDTSVSGDQKMSFTEEAAEEDAEADSWAEVMAAAEMAQKAANNRARAGAVKTENPLFQSADAEEEAAEGVAVAGVAAGILSEEVAAVREANPVFQAVEEEAATTTVT